MSLLDFSEPHAIGVAPHHTDAPSAARGTSLTGTPASASRRATVPRCHATASDQPLSVYQFRHMVPLRVTPEPLR
jgi:hypothetical protein